MSKMPKVMKTFEVWYDIEKNGWYEWAGRFTTRTARQAALIALVDNPIIPEAVVTPNGIDPNLEPAGIIDVVVRPYKL